MDLKKIIRDIKAEYIYKIELHAHTAPVSPCGRYDPRDLVRKYKEMGYDALAITNHLNPKMLDRPEDEFVEYYMNDFYQAFDEGKKLGLQVYFGVEANFADHANDYLVYGIDEADLRTICRYIPKSCREYYKDCKNDKNLVIQAHPGRRRCTLTPDCIDGSEAINVHPEHNSAIGYAVRDACKNTLLQTAGTDTHKPEMEGLSAILTRTLPKDSFELAQIIKNEDFVIAIDGDIVLQP